MAYATTFASGTVVSKNWLNYIDQRNNGVQHAGAVGDGVTDDYAAIQGALNTYGFCFLPRGKYRITQTLTIPNGAWLVGECNFFWQYRANYPSASQASIIFYDGASGTNSCVINCSTQSVGTLPSPASDESTTLRNVRIEGLVIDGNAKAEFGLYTARCGLGNVFRHITVTGTKKRGFWGGEMWSSEMSHLYAIHNYGSGGSFGEDLFSWSTGCIVNAMHFHTLIAFKNGIDQTYNETSAPTTGVGWIINVNRTCNFFTVVCELNYGAGAYVSPRTGPNLIKGLYLEDNCYFDPVADAASSSTCAVASGAASYAWGVYGYNRSATGATIQTKFESVFGASPGSPTRYQYIKLTGDTSAGLVAEPIEPWLFEGIYGVREIRSDFYNYGVKFAQAALIDSSSSADLSVCLPQYGDPESVTGSTTTLYVGNTATGNKSGRDVSNLITFSDALNCARICKGVVTLNVAAMTSTSASSVLGIDGRNFTRRITIDGGTTGRFPNFSGSAVLIINWLAELTIKNMLSIDRTSIIDSKVVFFDCPLIRMGADATTGAALTADNSNVDIGGTTVINNSSSSAATKIGISIQGDSEVSVSNAAAGTITACSAANYINFDYGSGILRVSLTTATATWAGAASITRNTGGGGGMVLAPNGLNP